MKFRFGRSRMLAIDPTPKGIAYVVLEGPERLVDWGVTYVPDHSKHSYLDRFVHLVEEFSPDAVATESPETRHGRMNTRAKTILHRLKAYAAGNGLELRTVSRKDVRVLFGPAGKNKDEIAKALARFFPELEPSLPRPRKPWMAEQDRANVFDALSFGLAAYRMNDKLGEVS